MKIRVKLSLVFLLLVLIPLVLTTWIPFPLNRQALKRAGQGYQYAVADGAILELKSLLTEAQSMMETSRFLLARNKVQIQQQILLIKALIAGNGVAHSLSIYNKHGQRAVTVVAEKRKSPTAPNQLPSKLLLQKDLSYFFPPLFLDTNKEAFQPIVLRMTLNQKTFGYLWTCVSLQSFTHKLSALSQMRFEGQKEKIYLIDQSYQIVVHPNARKIGTQAPSVLADSHVNLRKGLFYAFEHKEKKVPSFLILHSIQELGLGIVVLQDQKNVYQVLNSFGKTALLIGSIFAILSILLGLFLAKKMTQPIQEISRATQQVAGGDFSIRVAIHNKDEIGEMAQSFNTMASDLEKYREDIIQETAIRTDLSRYLNPELIERIVSRKEKLQLGGRKQQISVMFADIVGFTQIVENNPPEKVVAILNELFTFVTEIVFKHGGIIDKFMGDCVMSVFGVPEETEEHALQAVQAAEEILHWLEIGNAKWKKELGQKLEMAIGINSGEAIAGNIGSQKRMEYTVIGKTVNLAASLEVLAQGGQILFSTPTWIEVQKDFECQSLGVVTLPGREEEVEIYSIIE